MRLGQRDGDADPGEHAVDDGRRDHQGAAGDLEVAQRQLYDPGAGGRETDGLPAQLLDQAEDHHGEAGGRTGDLQRGTRQQAGDDPARDGADQARDDRSPRGEGDAQRKRDGDQEDDEGGREVAAEIHGVRVTIANARGCQRTMAPAPG